MEFDDIPQHDIERLQKIREFLGKAEKLMSEISNETRDKMLDHHTENHNLPHCIRWGDQAVEELLEEVK